MKWRGIGQTDVGRRREQNEDAYFVDDDLGLYVVSDGMGGHAAGEVASAQAIRSIVATVKAANVHEAERARAVEVVRQSIVNACIDVYNLAKSSPNRSGMGCTVTVALVKDDYAAIAHVGDSRCYLYRAEKVSQVTSDHTVGAEMHRAGLLSSAEFKTHPYSNVLSRSVGTQATVQVDAFDIDAIEGDVLLLCSDGFSEYIESNAWLAEHFQGAALDATVEELIDHANAQGGKDNITVVLAASESKASDESGQRHAREISGRVEALGSVFLFEHLSTALLSRLLTHCEVTSFDTDAVIVKEGDTIDDLLVITKGSAILTRGSARLGVLKSGECVGTTSLLKPRAARATLRASSETTVLLLPRDSFWEMVRARPWFGINLLERLVRQLSRSLDDSVSRRDDGDDTTTPLLQDENL